MDRLWNNLHQVAHSQNILKPNSEKENLRLIIPPGKQDTKILIRL